MEATDGMNLPMGMTERKYRQLHAYDDLKLSKISEEAYEVAFRAGERTRNVLFDREDGTTSWGIEKTLPLRLTDKLQKIYSSVFTSRLNRADIDTSPSNIQKASDYYLGHSWFEGIGSKHAQLPKLVENIKILNLHPQEELKLKDRNIQSTRGKRPWHDSSLFEKLTLKQIPETKCLVKRAVDFVRLKMLGKKRRNDAIGDLFYDAFVDDPTRINKFIKELEVSGVKDVVFVSAHGDYNDVVGEEYTSVNEKTDLDKKQNPGNRVRVEEIIKKYKEEGRPVALIFTSCYTGHEGLERFKSENTPIIIRNRAYAGVGRLGIVSKHVTEKPTQSTGEKMIDFLKPPADETLVDLLKKFDLEASVSGDIYEIVEEGDTKIELSSSQWMKSNLREKIISLGFKPNVSREVALSFKFPKFGSEGNQPVRYDVYQVLVFSQEKDKNGNIKTFLIRSEEREYKYRTGNYNMAEVYPATHQKTLEIYQFLIDKLQEMKSKK